MRSVRDKIIIMFAVVLLGSILLTGVFRWGLARTRRSIEETNRAYQELQALTSLSTNVGNQFFELAEILLVNEDDEGLRRATREAEKSFEQLTALEREQALKEGDDRSGERTDVQTMYMNYRELASTSELILTLHASGRNDEAVAKFHEVHNRMDDIFMASIQQAAQSQAEIVYAQTLTTQRLSELLERMIMVSIILLIATGTILASIIIQSVIRPISDLVRGAETYAQGDLEHRVPVRSKDELGRLAESFNVMAAQLSEQRNQLEAHNAKLQEEIKERTKAEMQLRVAQSELCDASRRAGMTDVATGVLHNVGNALNSVNVATSTVNNCLRASKLPLLQQAATVIEHQKDHLTEFLTNDDRGRHLPQFLTTLAQSLAHEQETMINELQVLGTNIDHIKAIVNMQQQYARMTTFHEMVVLSEVIRDAERMSISSAGDHGIRFEHAFGRIPPFKSDKHRLIQILINLITNAKNSVLENRSDDRCIILRLEHDATANEAVISVEDNGGGILAEHMPKLFTQGFTTRDKGHGYGLHASVLAAQELGGTLTAQSDGTSRGATFTLRIPMADAKQESSPSVQKATSHSHENIVDA